MNIIWIAASAFAGGIGAAVLGWLDSGEAFAVRKFSASVVRALVAAVLLAVGYTFTDGLTLIDIGIAFCGGAGVDVIGNRISGAIRARPE